MSEFVFSPKPIDIVHGDGVHLYDESGTAYLDAGASYGCAPVGHCHARVVEAIEAQAESLLFVQGSYPTTIRRELIERLVAVAPDGLDHVWLCNSGTEANEAALKFARSATGRSSIVAAKGAFHGRTMGSLSATWKPAYRRGYEPLLEDVTFVTYGDVDELAAAIDGETAAVILEPILGEGGVVPAPAGYLRAARELTEDAGAALIFDEVQTGMGRTGAVWGSEHDGIVPDVITAAKGLASGLPIGTTMCAEWIATGANSHGSTYSGSPVVAAAAGATLDVLFDESLVANAATVGDYLKDALVRLDAPIDAVRGRGLLIGIERRTGIGRVLGDMAVRHQVLALPAGRTVLRLLPPLTINREDADQIVAAVKSVLAAEEVAS